MKIIFSWKECANFQIIYLIILMLWICTTHEGTPKPCNKREDKGIVFFNSVKYSEDFNYLYGLNKTLNNFSGKNHTGHSTAIFF